MTASSSTISWMKGLCAMFAAPLLVVVIGGLIVESLKPGNHTPAPSPLPNASLTDVKDYDEKKDAKWMQDKWWAGYGDLDILLAFRDRKIIMKGILKGRLVHSSVWVRSNQGDNEFVPETPQGRLEKIVISSASTEELIVTSHLTGGEGVNQGILWNTKYEIKPSQSIDHYTPVQHQVSACSWTAWRRLACAIGIVLLTVLPSCLFLSKPAHQTTSGGVCVAVFFLGLGGLITGVVFLIYSISYFIEAYKYATI